MHVYLPSLHLTFNDGANGTEFKCTSAENFFFAVTAGIWTCRFFLQSMRWNERADSQHLVLDSGCCFTVKKQRREGNTIICAFAQILLNWGCL